MVSSLVHRDDNYFKIQVGVHFHRDSHTLAIQLRQGIVAVANNVVWRDMK